MSYKADRNFIAAFHVLGIPVWFWRVGDHPNHKKGCSLTNTLIRRAALSRYRVIGVYVFGWKDPMKIGLRDRLKG